MQISDWFSFGALTVSIVIASLTYFSVRIVQRGALRKEGEQTAIIAQIRKEVDMLESEVRRVSACTEEHRSVVNVVINDNEWIKSTLTEIKDAISELRPKRRSAG
jgi:CRISPR/Cas system-associated protein Cas5 (RAMP superfamily)